MFPVHESNDDFLAFTAELRARLDQEAERMESIKGVTDMCDQYDAENKEHITMQVSELQKPHEQYDEWVKHVQEQHDNWARHIVARTIDAQGLNKAIAEITPRMAKLNGNVLSQDVLDKISFLHKQACLEIVKAHKEMIAKKMELEHELENMRKVASTALGELEHIKDHPHMKRYQLIESFKKREVPGVVLHTVHRTMRHARATLKTVGSYAEYFVGANYKKTS